MKGNIRVIPKTFCLLDFYCLENQLSKNRTLYFFSIAKKKLSLKKRARAEVQSVKPRAKKT